MESKNCKFAIVQRDHPKTLCSLFSDPKGIQWDDADATLSLPSVQRGPLRLNPEIISIISKLWI